MFSKEFFTTDYRGIVGILEDSSDLMKVLELKEVPHYTTLQKATQRLLKKKIMRKLIESILVIATKEKIVKTRVQLAALDGTGFEFHYISRYFVHRQAKTTGYNPQSTFYTRFPKVGVVCDVTNHLGLSSIPERGPKFDRTHYRSALKEAALQKTINTLLADAGYDSEANHVHAREMYGMRTVIPPKIGCQSDVLPRGKYRRLMRTRFPKQLYGQR